MLIPLFTVIIIAAGGLLCVLVAIITVIILKRKKRRHTRALEHMRMSHQIGSNVDLRQVQTYSPTKGRSLAWADQGSLRNKLQRSPTHQRTLREASSRDSIRPLLKHKKTRTYSGRPMISIVDTSNLEVIEPSAVYKPSGRPAQTSLTPISERATPELVGKIDTYRDLQFRAPSSGWWEPSERRPLRTLPCGKRRSVSDSATALRHHAITTPAMPKSILVKPGLARSLSMHSQIPGPGPANDLPPTPRENLNEESHSSLLSQVAHAPGSLASKSISSYIEGNPESSVFEGYQYYSTANTNLSSAAHSSTRRSRGDQRFSEHGQYELQKLREPDNSPARSTKSSIRSPFRNHNSFRASVEHPSGLIREKSSSLSLSLQDNWHTPSKDGAAQCRDDSRYLGDPSQNTKFLSSPLPRTGAFRNILQDSKGNSNRLSPTSAQSSQSFHSAKQLRKPSRVDKGPEAGVPRAEGHKRSSTHRVVVQSSRPNSIAHSAILEDEVFEAHNQRQSSLVSEVSFEPITHSQPPGGLRPPSVTKFEPQIERVPTMPCHEDMPDDPIHENPSPLYSICDEIMIDEPFQRPVSPLERQSTNCGSDIKPWAPLRTGEHNGSLSLPPPTRETALSSSPPGSRLKLDPLAICKPKGTPHGARPLPAMQRSPRTSPSRHTITGPRSQPLSLRQHPGRHMQRMQNRSPLRYSMRLSNSPNSPRSWSLGGSRESSAAGGGGAMSSSSAASLARSQARLAAMVQTVTALRRQNSDVSQCDSSYLRLSENHADGKAEDGGVYAELGQDPFIENGTPPAYLPGYEHTGTTAMGTKVTMLGRQRWDQQGWDVVDLELKKIEPESEKDRQGSERGLSPEAKAIMAKTRQDHYETRKSQGRSSNWNASDVIGEEKRSRDKQRSRKERLREQMQSIQISSDVSPGSLLTAAGAF